MRQPNSMLADERAVLDASALLDITEYRLFKIAYLRWYGVDSSALVIERHFVNYMFNSVVPHWVRSLAREILRRQELGLLQPGDYGVGNSSVDRQTLRRGRWLIGLLSLVCLLLFLLGNFYEGVLQAFKNCYFPPCY